MQEILSNTKQIKPGDIPDFKLKQLQYEIDTWKRLHPDYKYILWEKGAFGGSV